MSKDVIPMGRPVRELPADAARELAALKARQLAGTDEPHRLDAYLAALADKGWGYQPAATVLGVSRQTVDQHVRKGRALREVYSFEVPELPARPARPMDTTLHLTPQEIKKLRSLQKSAVKLRGHHKPNDPRRLASEELSRFINELTRAGITYREIGAAIGVKPMTVRARLKRHGHRLVSPGLKAYNKPHRPEETTHAHAS